jgi:hypothetical protein
VRCEGAIKCVSLARICAVSAAPNQFKPKQYHARVNVGMVSPASFIHGQAAPIPGDGTPSQPHTFCDYSTARTDEDGMSYSDKRSGIVFAIATTFVIAGSTSSHAVPPQAITEEVKSCKAISNDQQRLKCFDGLFADKPNPPNAADKSANEGNWQIEESKSPADGSAQVVAANLVGDTVLILRCKDQITEAAFSTKYNYLGSRSVDVTLRINDDKPFKQVWKASMDGRAAFASDAVEFIRMLPDNAKLFVRTSRADGKTKEANFNLGNVSDIKAKIAHACAWDDPSNDSIGSVGRSGSPH